jgi:hypothetical protein
MQAGDSKTRIAIADKDSSDIYVYDIRNESSEPLQTFKVGHSVSVTHMRFNAPQDCVISTDQKGDSPMTITWWGMHALELIEIDRMG